MELEDLNSLYKIEFIALVDHEGGCWKIDEIVQCEQEQKQERRQPPYLLIFVYEMGSFI